MFWQEEQFHICINILYILNIFYQHASTIYTVGKCCLPNRLYHLFFHLRLKLIACWWLVETFLGSIGQTTRCNKFFINHLRTRGTLRTRKMQCLFLEMWQNIWLAFKSDHFCISIFCIPILICAYVCYVDPKFFCNSVL